MRSSLLLLILALGGLGCRKAHVEVRPDDKQSGPPRVTCKLPEPIAETTIPARCDLTIDKLVKVHAGESLTIGAGAKLTFAKGAGLALDGGTLTARGTAEEPIVLTGAIKSPGEWAGVIFTPRPITLSPKFADPDAGPDAVVRPADSASVLEHVVVEYGGARPEGVPEAAALYIRPFVGDTVALSHVNLRNNAGYALWSDATVTLTKLEALDAGDGKLRIPTELVSALGDKNTGTVVLHGSTDKSIVLPKRSYVFDYVGFHARTAPMTVDIEKGSTIKMLKGGTLSVDGGTLGAKLVAREVLFTSNETSPAAGDWRGITFSGDSAADVEQSTFEFGGEKTKGDSGLIRIRARDEKKLRIVGSTFRSITDAAFEANEDCKPWIDPALKNTSTGKLCIESPVMKSMKISAAELAAALGALDSKMATSSVLSAGKLNTIDLIDSAAAKSGGMGGGGLSTGGGGGGLVGIGSKGPKIAPDSGAN